MVELGVLDISPHVCSKCTFSEWIPWGEMEGKDTCQRKLNLQFTQYKTEFSVKFESENPIAGVYWINSTITGNICLEVTLFVHQSRLVLDWFWCTNLFHLLIPWDLQFGSCISQWWASSFLTPSGELLIVVFLVILNWISQVMMLLDSCRIWEISSGLFIWRSFEGEAHQQDRWGKQDLRVWSTLKWKQSIQK